MADPTHFPSPSSSDCSYLHRLPPAVALPDQGRDIFGRDKHGAYRDDMGGVGSLQRMNRTLYIGRIHEEAALGSHSSGSSSSSKDMVRGKDGKLKPRSGLSLQKRAGDALSPTEAVLWRHFSEWGEIETVRMLHHRGCGFVTYAHESGAQFAKEAMMHQPLDHGEVLNVRWATEDPNPAAKRVNKQRMTREGREKIEQSLTDEQREVGEAARRLELESQGQGGQRAAIEGASASAAAAEAADEEDEEMRRLIEENERGWRELDGQAHGQEEEAEEEEEDLEALQIRAEAELEASQRAAAEEQRQATQVAALQQAKASAPAARANAHGPGSGAGLVGADVLSGLAALKEIQQKQQASAPKGAGGKASSGLGGLAAYGSDSEED